jgi:hypothetical protein
VVDDDSGWGGEYLGPMSRSSPREVATASPGTKRCWSFIRWPKEQAGGGGGVAACGAGRWGDTREREREARNENGCRCTHSISALRGRRGRK